jgi:dihydrolipoamide dehydrogenase
MDYDAVVIGSGPGGYPCAIRLSQLGKHVAVIEEAQIGGECLNFGCIPSKSLIYSSHIVTEARKAVSAGLLKGSVSANLDEVRRRKEEAVKKLTSGVELLLKGNGVDIIKGRARIAGRNAVEVEGGELKCEQLVIATGTKFAELPHMRFDHKYILDVRDMLKLDKIPPSLLITGGGYIGVEMGQAFARLGSKVTIVEIIDQLLPGLEAEIVKVVEKALRADGIEIYTSSSVKEFDAASGKVVISGKHSFSANFDAVLLSVGKRADTTSLNLGAAGIETDAKGFIKVDAQCRTSAGWVYAVGDVTGPPFLAHRATYMGKVAAEAIAGMGSAMDANAIPAVVFTEPEIATVGMTEHEAAQRGIEVRTGRFPFAASGRAITMQQTEGFVKLVADRNGVLLGCQIVGSNASELIGEAALAIEMGATLEDIALTVHPHPTLPEAIMEAADAAEEKAVDILVRRKDAGAH